MYGGAQTRRLRLRRLRLMRRKPIRLTVWALGILFCAGLYVNGALLPLPSGGPWLALSGILLLLAAIALGARRNMPFGARV